jgi:hypothetical protein
MNAEMQLFETGTYEPEKCVALYCELFSVTIKARAIM